MSGAFSTRAIWKQLYRQMVSCVCIYIVSDQSILFMALQSHFNFAQRLFCLEFPHNPRQSILHFNYYTPGTRFTHTHCYASQIATCLINIARDTHYNNEIQKFYILFSSFRVFEISLLNANEEVCGHAFMFYSLFRDVIGISTAINATRSRR